MKTCKLCGWYFEQHHPDCPLCTELDKQRRIDYAKRVVEVSPAVGLFEIGRRLAKHLNIDEKLMANAIVLVADELQKEHLI